MNRAYLEGRYSFFYNHGSFDADASGYDPGSTEYADFERGYFDQLFESTPTALAA